MKEYTGAINLPSIPRATVTCQNKLTGQLYSQRQFGMPPLSLITNSKWIDPLKNQVTEVGRRMIFDDPMMGEERMSAPQASVTLPKRGSVLSSNNEYSQEVK